MITRELSSVLRSLCTGTILCSSQFSSHPLLTSFKDVYDMWILFLRNVFLVLNINIFIDIFMSLSIDNENPPSYNAHTPVPTVSDIVLCCTARTDCGDDRLLLNAGTFPLRLPFSLTCAPLALITAERAGSIVLGLQLIEQPWLLWWRESSSRDTFELPADNLTDIEKSTVNLIPSIFFFFNHWD